MRTLIRYEVDKKHIDYCTDEERRSTETQVKNNKTTARVEDKVAIDMESGKKA